MQLQLSTAAQVLRPDGQAVPLGPRDAALLAWLALEGPTPRNRLAALLWPDSPTETARNTLRQRLFQLRKQWGGALLAGQTTLSLAPGVTHDLAEAELLLAGQPLDWGGEFAHWLQAQRQACQARRRHALAERADAAEQAADWAAALTHAGQLLALDRLSESAHRRLMRLHYLGGDRAAALRAFDACEQLLKDEVGTRPSAETLALLATVESAASAAAPAPATMPASVLRPPRMVGRDNELAALAHGWQAGQVLALVGEAGMGKSRLLQEFADLQSCVVRAAARPGDAGVPFATLGRLLRAVAAHGGAAPAAALPDKLRGLIAHVLPELQAVSPAPTRPTEGEGQRMQLLRAVQAFMEGHAAVAGLVVDDLHFADEASLEMLAALIDGSPPAGPRWALAWRPAELASPVQVLHDGLLDEARLCATLLRPLDEAALAHLVDSLGLPGVSGAALAPGLHRATGGNPLYVLETLKQAWVDQTLSRLPLGEAFPRPLSIGRLIERRITRLSPAALALARVASLAGVDFGVPLAERVLGVSAMQFADALNELEAAQVLRGNAFAHDLVFEAVLASVPATIAAHTHAQVAAWLEEHGGEAARIAQHWTQANQGLRALPWLDRAAQAAGATARCKEQVAFLELKSAIEEGAGDRASAFRSQLQAAELLVVFDSSADRGNAQCDRLDALAVDANQRLQAKTQRANRLYMRGEREQAVTLARQALRDAALQPVGEAALVACRMVLATGLALLNRTSEAIPLFEACAGWMEVHGGSEQRGEFHGNLAMTYSLAGRLVDSRRHHDQALDLARHAGRVDNILMCLNNAAANRIYSGLLGEGEDLLARLRLQASRSDDTSSVEGFAGLQQVICDYQQGRYRRALQTLDDSAARLHQFAPGFRASVLVHLAVCWWHLGQWSRLQQTTTELSALGPSAATRIRMAMLHHRMSLALGRPAKVDTLQACLDQAAELPELRHMLELELLGSHEDSAALTRLEAIAAEARDMGYLGTVIAALYRAAPVAATLGDAPRARQLVVEALALAERACLVRQYPAELWLHCGEALACIGDASGASALFARGRDWVLRVARDEVPGAFRAGFLERNPVNRALLARATKHS